jgi:hypothetical protein
MSPCVNCPLARLSTAAQKAGCSLLTYYTRARARASTSTIAITITITSTSTSGQWFPQGRVCGRVQGLALHDARRCHLISRWCVTCVKSALFRKSSSQLQLQWCGG